MDRSLILQRIRVHHVKTSFVFFYKVCVERYVYFIRFRIIRHPVSVFPVRLLHSFCQRILFHRISVFIFIITIIGRDRILLIRIIRRILYDNNILVGRADGLHHARIVYDLLGICDLPCQVIKS